MRAKEFTTEISYPGNIGMHEVHSFYKTASPAQKAHFKRLVNSKKNKEAWKLVQTIVGVTLNEGGNVFKGKTNAIKRENIEPTLEHYFAELKSVFPQKANIFDTAHFHPLGSVGKKPISGDIDLGVDVGDILDQEMSDEAIAKWNVDPKAVKAEAEKIAKRARTATPEQIMLKAFLRQLTVYINAHAPNLHTDEKKVSAGNIFGLYPQYDPEGTNLDTGVQVDWMIGNIGWLNFSYYSSEYPADSNVKGLHRTQLMLAAFNHAGYSFSHVDGVKDKSTGEIVAHDPKTALQILSDAYGKAFTKAKVEDYYKLHKILKSLPIQDYNAILDIYLKILESTRADIPDDMQDYWITNQTRLGLTGKFLPSNSALASHRTEDKT
jgi:hypothetical protein